MRFYRVAIATGGSGPGSAGFSWHASKREAMAAAIQCRKNAPDEEPPTMEAVTIEASHAGILRALGRFASHPDNG